MVLIAIAPQRNQGVHETMEGIRKFEILFLSPLRGCHINAVCQFGSTCTVGVRRALGRHWQAVIPRKGPHLDGSSQSR